MKSCVVFFFFLVSLISSDTAAPPPGIKVRITEKAKDVLKDLGLMYLKGLVNQQFPIEKTILGINSLTLTKLQVDPDQVDFRLQEKTGLHVEIRDLNFELQPDGNNVKIITGDGVSATITVRMKQSPEGHLSVEIQYCKVKTDTIRTKSNNFSGEMLGILIKVLKNFFMAKICPALQPMINDKLKDLSTMRIHEDRQLDLDFSLSKDIAMTSSSFDISFKGLFTVHGQAVDTDSIRPGKEPVFTETNKMIYVGFSEFFFNVAAMAIYKSGPFEVDTDILNKQLPEWVRAWMPKRLWDTLFNVVGIASGPFKVELTKAPDVHISKDGLSATVDIEVKSDGQQSLRMTCRDNMNVEFKERHLIPVFQNPKCEDTIGTIKKKIQTGVVLNTYIYIINKLFVKEIPIPLPAELSIIDAKTQFEVGYLVVGGSLTFNPQSSSNAGG